ncbi:IS982 family transposase [Bdellovibrionota bacterium FG-2]
MIKQINLLELFCYVDDFCKEFEPQWYRSVIGKRTFHCDLAMSEVLTILIAFQFSGFKTFKYFYSFLQSAHKNDFPKLLSYSRFVEIERHFFVPLISFLEFHFVGCSDISYVDSTPLKICHNKRIYSNKVFKQTARRGKSTMGWFFGFKLHIATNEKGELLSAQITKGNVDDRKVVPSLCKNIRGRLFGDKGYISQKLFEEMLKKGLRIVTALRTKMKPKLMVFGESELLKKRSMIESVFHILKNILLLNHTRHRSQINCMINIIGALCAYCLYPGKPSIKLDATRTASPALIFI